MCLYISVVNCIRSAHSETSLSLQLLMPLHSNGQLDVLNLDDVGEHILKFLPIKELHLTVHGEIRLVVHHVHVYMPPVMVAYLC